MKESLLALQAAYSVPWVLLAIALRGTADVAERVVIGVVRQQLVQFSLPHLDSEQVCVKLGFIK